MTVMGRFAVMAATVLLCAPLSKAAYSGKVDDPDAYAVYSELMNNATRGHADKGLWMLSDTITSSAADRPCRPDPNAPNGEYSLAWTESPQHSIKPPVADKARLQEALDDFEKNCHETGLTAGGKVQDRLAGTNVDARRDEALRSRPDAGKSEVTASEVAEGRHRFTAL